MIEKIVGNFLPCLINMTAVMYVLSKILDRRTQWKSAKTYTMILFLTILSILNFLYVDNFIRILTSTFAIIVSGYILFREDLHKTFVATIFEQIITFIAEILFALIMILIFKIDTNGLFNDIQGTLLINIGVSIIAIGLVNIKPLLKFMRKITNFVVNLNGMTKYLLMIILMVTLNVLLMFVYSSTDNISMLFINLSFILIYSFIVYGSLNEKNKNMIFKAENKALMDNLNEYEKILDLQRVANHENKNQLLAIKGMAQQNEDIVGYIDEIVKEHRSINDNLYSKTKHIPSGGMQGIMYQKMLVMNDKKIKVNLDISKSIKNLDFDKINSKLNYDICRILGVFLDNAIEETEKISKKEKEINVSMYGEENQLVIEISNYFLEMPNLEKMDEKGYTTKSKGHGYGLPLVKDIVEKNENIENYRQITKEIFTQGLRIKGF